MAKKIASFTGELNDPSSRFRLRVYEDVIKKNGYSLKDFYSKAGKYPPSKHAIRLFWFILINLERSWQIIKYSFRKYDITFLQREMISTLFSFERFVKKPIIFDVDDSIHLGKRGENIIKIAKKADFIICGNIYLADFYRNMTRNVLVIPTPIDIHRYSRKILSDNNSIVIGWIGTQSNFEFLYKVEKALQEILTTNTNVSLVIVSNERPKFEIICTYTFVKWSEETEVQSIHSFDIGLMPLENSEWTKGKCSFKMLQYMSCGIPVVVSPVGMNVEVLSKGEIGFSPTDYYEGWIESLTKLIQSYDLRVSMGLNGRNVVEKNYSVEICSKDLLNVFKALEKI